MGPPARSGPGARRDGVTRPHRHRAGSPTASSRTTPPSCERCSNTTGCVSSPASSRSSCTTRPDGRRNEVRWTGSWRTSRPAAPRWPSWPPHRVSTATKVPPRSPKTSGITLVAALAESSTVAASHGLGISLHPHYGTVVERPDEIERVLAASPVDLLPRHRARDGRWRRPGRGGRARSRPDHPRAPEGCRRGDRGAGATRRSHLSPGRRRRVVPAAGTRRRRPRRHPDRARRRRIRRLDRARAGHGALFRAPAGAGPMADAAESIRFLQRALEAV